MSLTTNNSEFRIQIEAFPSEPTLEIQDSTKIVTNSDTNESHDVTHVQPEIQQSVEDTSALPTSHQNILHTPQYVNLPPDPPPYSEFPIYTIPLPSRQGPMIYDPPPPYDPTMRREDLESLDFPYQNYQQNRSSRFECKPDTLVPLGFCYCTLEQLIVTLAILGTFVFLGLGQIS